MHLGLILPNFGEGSTPAEIRRMAEAAEELCFDSVWATSASRRKTRYSVGHPSEAPLSSVFSWNV